VPKSWELTPEVMAVYRATARQRWEEEQRERARREERAWDLARQAAALLRKRFGATRIVVFGSLVQPGMFTLWSDVDIAAWDIQPQDTLRAIGAVFDLDADIQVNLVDVGTASTELLDKLEREGVEVIP
jgi:predicted nucleotidyltransferase